MLKWACSLFIFIQAGILIPGLAQPPASEPQIKTVEVEWYPVENERSRYRSRTRVLLSGRTEPGSLIQIDGESVTVLKNKKAQPQKVNNAMGKSNAEGFFEIALDLPYGTAQIPISVTTLDKNEKTFLLTFEVNQIKTQIPLNTKTSKRKPPAAAKKVRLWLGAGFTHQSYSQAQDSGTDFKFQTFQAPGLVARGGYWGDQWGLDFYFRDAPGKIESEAPYQVQSDKYSWQTAELKGLYQIPRTAKSRLWGLASQWQIRFGSQFHQVPFLETDASNLVSLDSNRFLMATLGIGLLLGQERDWTYEFALGIQHPISASGPGDSFKASSPLAFEAQIGGAYKFAPNWRLGLFSYSQSLSYTYEYQKSTVPISGKQSLFYTTFDLRLGYEF